MSRIVPWTAVVAAIGLTGCIGATDRSDFDEEVRSRGGGVTVDWIAESMDIVAVSVGVFALSSAAIGAALSMVIVTVAVSVSVPSLIVYVKVSTPVKPAGGV